jgi:hypothetical protein
VRALRLAAFLTLCLKDLLLQTVRSREEIALIVSSKDAFQIAAPEIVANTHFQQLHRERSSKTKNHGVRRRRTTATPHVLHQIRWNKSAFSGILRPLLLLLLLQRCKKHKEIAIETETKNVRVRGRDDTR